MRTLGRDKSTPKRGQRQTARAEYGVRGDWLGIPKKWLFDGKEEVQTFVLDDGERLHVICVPIFEREEVFRAMGSTYSWSRNLAGKLLMDAILAFEKPHLWHHGLVTLRVINRQIVGIEETHAERLQKVPAPWIKHAPNQPPAVKPESVYRL